MADLFHPFFTKGLTTSVCRKCQFLPFIHHITYKVGFWYFKILCNRNTVSNKTYQYFDNKRLVRPGSKYPNWQISQPINRKAKFLHRDNIYLVDLKSYITYQNIRVGAIVRAIFIPWNNWNVKKSYLTTYMNDTSITSR